MVTAQLEPNKSVPNAKHNPGVVVPSRWTRRINKFHMWGACGDERASVLNTIQQQQQQQRTITVIIIFQLACCVCARAKQKTIERALSVCASGTHQTTMMSPSLSFTLAVTSRHAYSIIQLMYVYAHTTSCFRISFTSSRQRSWNGIHTNTHTREWDHGNEYDCDHERQSRKIRNVIDRTGWTRCKFSAPFCHGMQKSNAYVHKMNLDCVSVTGLNNWFEITDISVVGQFHSTPAYIVTVGCVITILLAFLCNRQIIYTICHRVWVYALIGHRRKVFILENTNLLYCCDKITAGIVWTMIHWWIQFTRSLLLYLGEIVSVLNH